MDDLIVKYHPPAWTNGCGLVEIRTHPAHELVAACFSRDLDTADWRIVQQRIEECGVDAPLSAELARCCLSVYEKAISQAAAGTAAPTTNSSRGNP